VAAASEAAETALANVIEFEALNASKYKKNVRARFTDSGSDSSVNAV